MNRYFFKKLKKNTFLQRVTTLAGGTAIGQIVTILTLPFLTRLYSPESFSVLAVYVSILSLFAVVACLRFEIAIPIPKQDGLAAALFVLSIISVLGFTILSAIIVHLFSDSINYLTNNKLKEVLWLIPVGVFLVGLYNALQYWKSRNKEFGLISRTRITQSLSGNAVKLGSGFIMGAWTPGLIIGQILSQGAGAVVLGRSLIKNDLLTFKKIKLSNLKLALNRYKRFPKYSTWEAVANAGSIQVPVILIAYYAVGEEAGFLMIAMQLLSVPMALIGGAVAQVYLAEGAEHYNNGNIKKFTYYTIKNMAKLACIPLILAALISPFLMPYLLGEHWQRTGILISWMTPWFFMQFISSPISMVLHITGNQKTALLIQTFGFFFRVGTVLIAANFASRWVGEFYAVSGFVFYSFYFLMILFVLNTLDKRAA